MLKIQQVTSDARQTQNLILPDGSLLGFSLYFSLQQAGWFASLTYGDFVLNGMRVVVSPNMLRQYQNLLPFGLACFSTTQKREPTQQQDFSSGAFELAVLTDEETVAFEQYLETT